MSSNSGFEKDVFMACAEHSWQEHGPSGRDGEEGRYAKHGINSVGELETHIRASVTDEKTKGFTASNDREVYMSPPNANGYSTEVILNYQRDENGKFVGGSCVLTDRAESEFNRLHNQEIRNSDKTPEIKMQNAYVEIRKEVPRDNKHQEKQAEPEKTLTWYEVQKKRSALHNQIDKQQEHQAVKKADDETRDQSSKQKQERKMESGKLSEMPEIDKQKDKTPEEQLLDRFKKREQERQKQKKDKDRGFRR